MERILAVKCISNTIRANYRRDEGKNRREPNDTVGGEETIVIMQILPASDSRSHIHPFVCYSSRARLTLLVK